MNVRDYTSAKVLAHVMSWFGTPGHIDIGYHSADIATCDRQTSAMAAQGIAGINVDYYGPESPSALAAIRLLSACERTDLLYSLCIDQGAVRGLVGDTATQEYIRILRFAADAFLTSPSYFQDAGRYVVNFFGEPSGVNWPAIRANVPAKLALIFQGSSGFTHPESDGSFGWVNPLPDHTDINLPAIQAFNAAAAVNPSKIALYPAYPGFDDSMASWGKKRMMSRRLGRTLTDTLGQVPKTAKYVLLSTWNDYEEGSQIEGTT